MIGKARHSELITNGNDAKRFARLKYIVVEERYAQWAACLHKARLSRWRTDHEKARYAWGYRWGRNIDCGAPLASMVAKECGAIACQRCSPRTAANCDERCRCQPKGVSPRIPQRGLHKCCWLRLWIVLRLWMSGGFQLLGTLRNKLRCTLRHLRQQLRHSLRASEIRLRRTVP